MKEYEQRMAGERCLPLLPVVARLDGKNFSTFTKGLGRPYDVRLTRLMIDVTAFLVEETNAACGYTQSDEITLGWYSPSRDSQIYFDGRVQKMVSVLAATCSVAFNARLPEALPEKNPTVTGKLLVFDCRVWQLPTLDEAANAFLWRELDATKNSISMAAQAYYSHKELMNKSGSEKMDMLHLKGQNWNDYPAEFKRGSYVQRRKVAAKLAPQDIEKLPPKHHARTNPDLVVERSEYRRLDLPPLARVANRVGVLFRGEDPALHPEKL